jgi:hypothetical protein
MAELDKLVEELSKLSVLEASELVKLLEEKWAFPLPRLWPLPPPVPLPPLLKKKSKKRLNSLL